MTPVSSGSCHSFRGEGGPWDLLNAVSLSATCWVFLCLGCELGKGKNHLFLARFLGGTFCSSWNSVLTARLRKRTGCVHDEQLVCIHCV